MNFKLPLFALLALSPIAAMAAPSAAIADTPSLLPKPNQLTATGDIGFSLDGPLKIQSPAGKFDDALFALKHGLPGGISASDSAKDALTISLDPALGKESYRLTVTSGAVTLAGGDEAGVFYGVQTLVQAVVRDAAGKAALPALEIEDSPRFGWRGLELDPCRHFIKPENMKRMIDIMALYKFNKLHWHLTDDQGWRIEIKKYPKLTSIGSVRAESRVPGSKDFDGKPYGPFFYTQEQIREIVAYAKARHITVIPEIEMPGHAVAAISAYPELGNDDLPDLKPKVWCQWGVSDYVFSPKESTFKFLDDVIGEVAALFPDAPYIHIGGDECPKTQWNASPFAQKLMEKEKLLTDGKPDAHKLQSWFIQRVEKMVNARGKKLIGWDEIQEGGLSPTATMMVWRNRKFAVMAAKNGNDVIMTPAGNYYLDFSPGKTPDEPGFQTPNINCPVEKVYDADPIPEGLTPEEAKHVLGVQGNLWSEYMFNQAKLEYMAFPRALVIAEVGWYGGPKDLADLKKRIEGNRPQLDALKVNYRQEDGSPAQPDAKILNE